MRVNVQVLINKCSCANEVYKIAIIRWRIASESILRVNMDALYGSRPMCFTLNATRVVSFVDVDEDEDDRTDPPATPA